MEVKRVSKMPKRRHSKRTHPVSPESLDFARDGEFIEPFIEGPKKPEYQPEKEERFIVTSQGLLLSIKSLGRWI